MSYIKFAQEETSSFVILLLFLYTLTGQIGSWTYEVSIKCDVKLCQLQKIRYQNQTLSEIRPSSMLSMNPTPTRIFQ